MRLEGELRETPGERGNVLSEELSGEKVRSPGRKLRSGGEKLGRNVRSDGDKREG